MYSFEVRFWIERQALYIDLVHVYAIVLHYFLQVLNRLVGEWVNQLNALKVLGCNLLLSRMLLVLPFHRVKLFVPLVGANVDKWNIRTKGNGRQHGKIGIREVLNVTVVGAILVVTIW